MRRTASCVVIALLSGFIPSAALARGGGHYGGSHGYSHSHSSFHSHSSHYSSTGHRSTYSPVAKRDKNGRIARSSAAKREFEKETGYPHGRKGYVVDHVVPLKRGGADAPSNMQWQTKEAAKEKDKTE